MKIQTAAESWEMKKEIEAVEIMISSKIEIISVWAADQSTQSTQIFRAWSILSIVLSGCKDGLRC